MDFSNMVRLTVFLVTTPQISNMFFNQQEAWAFTSEESNRCSSMIAKGQRLAATAAAVKIVFLISYCLSIECLHLPACKPVPIDRQCI